MIRFSTALYDLALELLRATYELIRNCECREGCPSCVGPVGEVSKEGKSVAVDILLQVLDCTGEAAGTALLSARASS